MSHTETASIPPLPPPPKSAGNRSQLRGLLAAAVVVESGALVFFLWFLLPKLAVLLNDLRDKDSFLPLVFSLRTGLSLFALGATIAAIWTLSRAKEKAGVWILAGLFLLMLIVLGLIPWAVVTLPIGGLSSSIR